VAKSYTPEELASVEASLGRQSELWKKIKASIDAANASQSESSEKVAKTAEELSKSVQLAEQQVKAYAKLGDSYDARVMQAEAALNLERQNLAILEQKIANSDNLSEADLERLRVMKEQVEAADHALKSLTNQTEAIKEAVKASQELGGALGGALNQYGKHQFFNTDNLKNLGKAFRGGSKSLVPFIASMGTAAIGSFVNALIQLVFQVDEAESAFKRTAGASDEMARAMTNNWTETRLMGVELAEMSAVMGELKGTYTDFTMVSATARDEVAKTGALLAEVGVSNSDFAKGMQLSTKAFGQTAESAAAAGRDIANFADIIGVAPQQLGADFANMGGSLAKMGDQGIRAFKDLAIVSKTTGLEMSKILAITDKFDTFEGAADQAGKLNAALGGNFVNAMDLMTATDPAERFGMIRDSILDTGLTFDDMSYYQRKFYTDALGLKDVSDLAGVLSGDMSNLEGATQKSSKEYAKLAERTKAIQSITEKFKNLMMDMIPVMTEVIDDVQAWMTALTKDEDKLEEIKEGLKTFAYALVEIGKGLVFVVKHWEWFLGAFIAWKAVMGGLQFAKFIKSFTSIGDVVDDVGGGIIETLSDGMADGIETVTDSVADGIKNVGEKASASAKGILALGAAVLMIGAGIAIAALGFAQLAIALSELDGPQLIAFTAALILFGLGLALVMGVLYALVVSGALPVAVAGLLAFGAAVFLIGAGVAIAAVGIGQMAKGMAVLFTAIEVDKLVALTAFIATLAAMAPLLVIGAAALVVLTGALFSMAAAIALMPTSDMEKFSEFFDSIAAVETNQMHLIAAGVKKINTELKQMPETKALALKTTMQMATTQQAVAGIAATAEAVKEAVSGIFGSKDKNKGQGAVSVNVDVGDVLLDGDVVGKFVKKTMGEIARDGVRGTV
tara:strand:+ start:9140 stop:11854 length:2715 start_codon:yes stop_codon:yes gene_type:complete